MTNTERASVNQHPSVRGFLRSAESLAAIETYFSVVARPAAPYRFRQMVVFHNGDLGSLIEDRAPHLRLQVSRSNANAPVFKVTSPPKKQRPATSGLFVILPATAPNLHRLATISDGALWNRCAIPLVKALYPYGVSVFFRQSEVRDAMLRLETQLPRTFRIQVSELTMKRKKPPSTALFPRTIETDRLWSDFSVRDAFDQAEESANWFASLQFILFRQDPESGRYRMTGKARVYKRGDISYDWYHSEVAVPLLSALELSVTKRLELFRGRGIKERSYKHARPIEIAYPEELFSDVQEVRRFGEAMAGYPNSTRAVFHPNPYYHASIADFLDGSSFEIWILSPTRVLILPQSRASQQAFERIVTHIFTHFREGSVSEYAQ